jgi:formate hydrogenlyase subunit 6/NADH:ubiquinone oxidoreductase subunit I
MPEVKPIKEEICSGCRLCALACSFFVSPLRAFSLSKSNIRIERLNGQNRFRIHLLERCLACGICVDYCHYAVLAIE